MTQRAAVAVSCLMFYHLVRTHHAPPAFKYASLAALSAMACVEKLGSIMNLVAVERDWVVVIANNEETVLAGLPSKSSSCPNKRAFQSFPLQNR